MSLHLWKKYNIFKEFQRAHLFFLCHDFRMFINSLIFWISPQYQFLFRRIVLECSVHFSSIFFLHFFEAMATLGKALTLRICELICRRETPYLSWPQLNKSWKLRVSLAGSFVPQNGESFEKHFHSPRAAPWKENSWQKPPPPFLCLLYAEVGHPARCCRILFWASEYPLVYPSRFSFLTSF